METSYINNSPIDQVQFKEFTEEDLKTIGTIKKCFQEFKFKLNNIDQIAKDLLTQLKAKKIPLDKEEIPYKIELIRQIGGNNTIEKTYKLDQVFFRCLGLKSKYFNSLTENFRESKEKHLELSNIYAEEFKMLIQNVFQPELNENNISILLELSDRFAFSELNKKCEDWFLDVLINEDFPNFMRHLAEHNSPQMLNIFAKIASKHFTKLARTSRKDFIALAKLCDKKKLEIKELDLSASKLDQECLEAIPFTIESLNLSYTSIKDNDLLFLKKLNLKHLNFSGCFNITDMGLKNLESLKNLEYLKLEGCFNITDMGLKDLGSMKNLQHLNLHGCFKITDASLKNLEPLNLEYLILEGCFNITDMGLKNLESMTNLQYLNLKGCFKITDASLKNLEPLKNLKYLNLKGCFNITDMGLKNLECLTHLLH